MGQKNGKIMLGRKLPPHPHRTVQLIPEGTQFGRLTVIKLDHLYERVTQSGKNIGAKSYIQYYLCKCECGNTCVVSRDALKRGKSRSCGCLFNESVKNQGARQVKSYINSAGKHQHRMSNTPIYNNYHRIKQLKTSKCEFKDITDFIEWSLDSDFKEFDNGFVYRYDETQPYNRENCYWGRKE